MSIKPPSPASDEFPSRTPSLEKQINDANMALAVEPSIVAITPDVYIGNFASSISQSLIFKHCITSIIAVTSNPPAAYTGSIQNQRRSSLPQVSYHYVECRDNNSTNLLQHLPQLCEEIDRLTKLGRVLVHCSQGLSRSPAVVVGYLMKNQRKGVDAVLAEVKGKRDVKIRESFMEQLSIWESCDYELFEECQREPTSERRAKKPYQELLKKLEGRKTEGEQAEREGGADRRGSV